MANAIVAEVLEFVRPIRLQVERVALDDVISDAITMAERHAPRGPGRGRASTIPDAAGRSRPTRTSCGSSSRTC